MLSVSPKKIDAQLGDLPILVFCDCQSTTSIPYLREVEGRLPSFYQVELEGNFAVEFIDVETSSRWNMLGIAVDGLLQGERLQQLPAYNAMWFPPCRPIARNRAVARRRHPRGGSGHGRRGKGHP